MADEFDQYKRSATPAASDEFAQYKRTATPEQIAPVTTSDRMGYVAEDLGKIGTGALKGLMHTGTALSPLLSKIPLIGETLAPSSGIKAAEIMSTPKDTPEKIGYGGEQIGEWLLPTGIEEKGGLLAARMLPKLGKVAAPLGRIVAGGLESGVRNKLQGGDFTSGSLMGGGAGVVGEAGKVIAPKLAESALGITKRMRGFGKTPGEAALGEIKHAVRPGTVAAEAGTKLGQLNAELEQAASRSTTPTTTQPAIKVVTDAMQKAKQQNNKTLYNALKDVHDQLTVEFSTGQPLPSNMLARQILDLKRGIGDLEGNWNPELQGKMKGTVRQVYRALDDELDRAVPGAEKLNQRMSSLMDVEKRGKSVERSDDPIQRMMRRVIVPTGALTGAVAGGRAGYDEYGLPGMFAGGALGLMVPELLGSPTAQMLTARAMRSPVSTRALRGMSSRFMKRKDQSNSQ